LLFISISGKSLGIFYKKTLKLRPKVYGSIP
jgi:hypothetical protein